PTCLHRRPSHFCQETTRVSSIILIIRLASGNGERLMAQSNGSGTHGTDPAGSARRAILWGGLICGVLDITSAVIISLANNGSPIRMLQGIAGAVLGPVTFEGGF